MQDIATITMDKLEKKNPHRLKNRPTVPTEEQPKQQTPGDSSLKPQNEVVDQ